MPEFLTLLPPKDALQRVLQALPATPPSDEIMDTSLALGRVTSEPIFAPHSLPNFARSTVDGYAVKAVDTFGASDTVPIYLSLIGEIAMGHSADLELQSTQCVLIHTGGMVPKGSDAVVMVEYTQVSRLNEVEFLRPVAPGENVIQIGEDVIAGEEVIPVGTLLRPAEIGGLMALGLTQVTVIRKPLIGVISSGDEVVSPVQELKTGQVRDVNTYALGALIEAHGGIAKRYGIFPDNVNLIQSIASQALLECDAVVITAGSSASVRDITAQVVNALGSPGVLVHGVNIKPGKPTILAVCNDKAVIGLPGNPVSALVAARLFVIPVVEWLLKLPSINVRNQLNLKYTVQAKLTINIPSQAGREDWVPVRLTLNEDGYQAEPLFGKSNLIFTLVRADGLVCVPPDITGVSAGEMVEVTII